MNLFGLTYSPYCKNIHFTITHDKEKHKILTIAMQKLHFASEIINNKSFFRFLLIIFLWIDLQLYAVVYIKWYNNP